MLFWVLIESFDFLNLFNYFRQVSLGTNILVPSNLYRLVSIVFAYISFSVSNDRDSEFLLKETLCYWFIYLGIFVIISLVLFINEELDTSLTEVFFETFFITWIFFYIPDFIIYGFKNLNNKITEEGFLLINFLLPFIEFFSNIIKVFTVSVRINTNYISGHLLITIFILLFEYLLYSCFNASSFLLLMSIMFIYLLEVLISLLQIYVMFILLMLYIQESNF